MRAAVAKVIVNFRMKSSSTIAHVATRRRTATARAIMSAASHSSAQGSIPRNRFYEANRNPIPPSAMAAVNNARLIRWI